MNMKIGEPTTKVVTRATRNGQHACTLGALQRAGSESGRRQGGRENSLLASLANSPAVSRQPPPQGGELGRRQALEIAPMGAICQGGLTPSLA
jgi:hypothetical protein